MQSDRARFRTFYEQHYEAVLAYALRRVEPAAAEDIVAETFLVAWRRFGTLPPDPLPWLFAVARKLGANHRRGLARRKMAVSRLGAEAPPAGDDPGEQIAARAEVLAAFRRLSPRDQETLALVAWEGLTADRAARVIGCSVGAFWVRLHRARRRLDRELQGIPTKTSRDDVIVVDDRMEMEG